MSIVNPEVQPYETHPPATGGQRCSKCGEPIPVVMDAGGRCLVCRRGARRSVLETFFILLQTIVVTGMPVAFFWAETQGKFQLSILWAGFYAVTAMGTLLIALRIVDRDVFFRLLTFGLEKFFARRDAE